MIEFALVALVPALAVSAILTAIARRVARAAGLVAAVRPDRLHTQPRPYGGGLAIADTLILIVGGAWVLGLYASADWLHGWLPPGVRDHLEARTATLARLAVGALVFFIIGLLDDRYGLSAWPKLLLQVFAAALAVLGLGIKATVWLEAPWAAEVVSILWIVAVVNAYNMLDHADGLAAAVGAVALVALAAGQMMMGEWFVPGVALVTAGALLGFLIHNFPPAKLFMGDAGSHLVGYILAALTISARYYFPSRGTHPCVVLVPLVVLAVPLFDAVCVVVGRIARRRNPMVGDATTHFGHRMLARGAGPRTVVLAAAGLAALAGGASLLMYFPACLLGVGSACAMLVLVAMLWARRAPERGETP